MFEAIQVTTTTGNRADADRIAALLVDRRLAACAQVSGPITSRYRWKGDVESAEEWVCTVKTTVQAYARVEQAIRESHPYEEPEIIATPILDGSKGYLQWIASEVEISGT